MNKTNFEHAIFAICFQIPFGVFGFWWVGAALGAGFFLGREHAQYEKHLTNGGPVGHLHPLAGFQIWNWNKDSVLDLVFPVVTVITIAGLFSLIK